MRKTVIEPVKSQKVSSRPKLYRDKLKMNKAVIVRRRPNCLHTKRRRSLSICLMGSSRKRPVKINQKIKAASRGIKACINHDPKSAILGVKKIVLRMAKISLRSIANFLLCFLINLSFS
jgi:flavoprotein